jgi:hypothetical protein
MHATMLKNRTLSQLGLDRAMQQVLMAATVSDPQAS